MTTDLDDRIALLESKRRANSIEMVRGAECSVEELNQAVRLSSILVVELHARADLLDSRATTLEHRIRRIWILVGAGAVAATVTAVVVVAFAFLYGEKVKSIAVNEAALIRETYATEVETAREEGEAALAAMQEDLANRSDQAAAQMTEIGADLAEITDDRDAVRQELEHFIGLRDRVGIELVDFRGRTVVVVPEGTRLRSWRAAGLSEVAHLNGRMYRLSEQ